MLPYKHDLPKTTIVNTRKEIHKVRSLNGFFGGKMQLVQNKMKIIVVGTPNFIPRILDSEGKIKD